jgi:hypothetical protein
MRSGTTLDWYTLDAQVIQNLLLWKWGHTNSRPTLLFAFPHVFKIKQESNNKFTITQITRKCGKFRKEQATASPNVNRKQCIRFFFSGAATQRG